MSRTATQRPALRAVTGATDLVAELRLALCEESDALKSGSPARLAAAESRKRHLLRLLCPRTMDAS